MLTPPPPLARTMSLSEPCDAIKLQPLDHLLPSTPPPPDVSSY